ncbi:MAG: FAD-dependent monooxygenase [Actinobacteria bacterium]|nr:FAD-dependent monooxygenase [Actinomycetota bacterium]
MKPLRVLVVGAGVSGISAARGLLHDGHEVTVFDQRPDVTAGGGAVTIWSNGATVLAQLGVDMTGAGQQLSILRVITSSGRPLATFDVAAMADRMGSPVRMVPRRVLLQRLLDGFPAGRIRCNSRVVAVSDTATGVQVRFGDGSVADGDLLIGADGLHSVVRGIGGARPAASTGWCSWQGLMTLPGVAEDLEPLIVVGERGSVGLWPAGGTELQWWFDHPWSADFVRPQRPVDAIRSQFSGWTDTVDRVLGALTDEHLAPSPFPHFRHPVPRARHREPVTLLGDALHTMPPTLAQGTNQALLDTMVLRKALADLGGPANRHGDVSRALRWYEKTRRPSVKMVSRVASVQVSHSEAMFKPAVLVSDRLMTWALTAFLRSTSHGAIAAEVSQRLDTGAGVDVRRVTAADAGR